MSMMHMDCSALWSPLLVVVGAWAVLVAVILVYESRWVFDPFKQRKMRLASIVLMFVALSLFMVLYFG